MKLSIFDTETLGQDPRVPEKMIIDEVGVITLEFNDFNELYSKYPVERLLAVLGSCKAPDEVFATVVKVLQVRGFAKVGVHQWHLSLLEQIATGRVIDPSTIRWRAKLSGYGEAETARVYEDLENRTDRQSVKSVLTGLMDVLAGSDVVFCRGTDFDVTLIGSLCRQWGVKEGYRHNIPRDIRTACDELLNDGVYNNMVTPERIADIIGEAPVEVHKTMYLWIERISKLRKTSGHQALVDCVLDLSLYLLLKAWRSGKLDSFTRIDMPVPHTYTTEMLSQE